MAAIQHQMSVDIQDFVDVAEGDVADAIVAELSKEIATQIRPSVVTLLGGETTGQIKITVDIEKEID